MTIELREATIEDAPAITTLLEEHALAAFGAPELSEEEIRDWLGRPKFWFRLAERDGQLAGYLDVYAEDNGRFPADIRTLEPDVAAALLAEAEALGRAHGASAVRAFVQGDEPVLRGVLQESGLAPIRHSFQMQIHLNVDLPAPEWPEGLLPRNLRPGEEERVYEAHMDAFADHWEHHRYSFEDWRSFQVEAHSFDPSLWWLVADDGDLAAISLNAWHFSGDPEFGWIHVLGVRPPWRRRGLATALLRHSFLDFRERGATRVGLGVDGENTTGAVRLYERVGMNVFRRNDIYEKTL
jgi:mycothiol synthase